MNDATHSLQRGIAQVVRLEQDLKRAATVAVTQGCATRVEGNTVQAADIPRARHELECRDGIDELANGPRGGDAVDVHALTGDVVHSESSGSVTGSSLGLIPWRYARQRSMVCAAVARLGVPT